MNLSREAASNKPLLMVLPSLRSISRWRRSASGRMSRSTCLHLAMDPPLVARICAPARSSGVPSMFVTVPPASLTSSEPAATSHGLRPNSQKPSSATACDRGEVERRRTGAPHALDPRHHVFPECQVEAATLAPIVGKSRREERSRQRLCLADVNRLAVELRALSATRGEHVFVQCIEDHAELNAAAMLIRDRDAERRKAVREVGGAVERIDDPSMLACLRAGAALLGEDRMDRETRDGCSR